MMGGVRESKKNDTIPDKCDSELANWICPTTASAMLPGYNAKRL